MTVRIFGLGTNIPSSTSKSEFALSTSKGENSVKKKTTAACVGLLAALQIFGGCSLLPEEDELQHSPVIVENQVVSYKTTFVQAGDIANTTEVVCTYKPVKTEGYAFDLEGEFFDTIFVSEGQHVMEGDLLAQLDISAIEASISSNQHEIDVANLNALHLQQERDLKSEQADALRKILPAEMAGSVQTSAEVYSSYQNRINSIYNNITVLQLRKNELLQRKAERQLHAGFEGTVTAVENVTNRDLCEQGKVIVTVADTATSMFTAKTKYHENFKPGQIYDMTLGDEIYSVEVVDLEPFGVVNEPGREGVVYFEFKDPVADFDQNSIGRINLVLEESKNTLYVLSSAIVTTSNGSIVYGFDENGVMTMIPVEVGISNDKYTEIKSGVTASQELILE